MPRGALIAAPLVSSVMCALASKPVNTHAVDSRPSIAA